MEDGVRDGKQVFPTAGRSKWNSPERMPMRTRANRLACALPFFLAAGFMVFRAGTDHIPLALAEFFLIGVGCIVAMTRSAGLRWLSLLVGGIVLGLLLYIALIAGLFGGHQ
jgi:hypothetical protein